jgi:hypothetical protein
MFERKPRLHAPTKNRDWAHYPTTRLYVNTCYAVQSILCNPILRHFLQRNWCDICRVEMNKMTWQDMVQICTCNANPSDWWTPWKRYSAARSIYSWTTALKQWLSRALDAFGGSVYVLCSICLVGLLSFKTDRRARLGAPISISRTIGPKINLPQSFINQSLNVIL